MTKREFIYHRNKKNRKWLERFNDFDVPPTLDPNGSICEDEGCSHQAVVKCVLDYWDENTQEWKEDFEWLCCDHANEAGYCMGCGIFIAGTGMEFTNNGYCDNCFDEIRSNDFDDEEDFTYGSLEY